MADFTLILANVRALHVFEHWMQSRLQEGSYLLLFGALFSCGLGFPLPEDIPLLFAGAAVGAGRMNLAAAAICAWCGIIGGDIVLYSLGRGYGLEVRRLRLIGRHLSQERLEKVHAMFEKWGVWVVAGGRMIAGVRGAMVVVAGATRFTFWKFLTADGLAALVSGGMFLLLGYEFGRNMDTLMARVHQGKQWVMTGLLALLIVIGIWIAARRRLRAARAGRRERQPALAEAPVSRND